MNPAFWPNMGKTKGVMQKNKDKEQIISLKYESLDLVNSTSETHFFKKNTLFIKIVIKPRLNFGRFVMTLGFCITIFN